MPTEVIAEDIACAVVGGINLKHGSDRKPERRNISFATVGGFFTSVMTNVTSCRRIVS